MKSIFSLMIKILSLLILITLIQSCSLKNKFLECYINQYFQEKYTTFLVLLKHQPIEELNHQELTDGINALQAALEFHFDDNIDKIDIESLLSRVFFARAKRYYLDGKYECALADLTQCSRSEDKAKAIPFRDQIIQENNKKIELGFPLNDGVLYSTEMQFSWDVVRCSDFYHIEVIDEYGNPFISRTLDYQDHNFLQIKQGLKYDVWYFWKVRAHFPNNTWTDWSERWKFIIRNPGTEKNKK